MYIIQPIHTRLMMFHEIHMLCSLDTVLLWWIGLHIGYGHSTIVFFIADLAFIIALRVISIITFKYMLFMIWGQYTQHRLLIQWVFPEIEIVCWRFMYVTFHKGTCFKYPIIKIWLWEFLNSFMYVLFVYFPESYTAISCCR